MASETPLERACREFCAMVAFHPDVVALREKSVSMMKAARAEGHRDGYTDGCNDTVAFAARAEGAKRGTCATCAYSDTSLDEPGYTWCGKHSSTLSESMVAAGVGCTAHEPREEADGAR